MNDARDLDNPLKPRPCLDYCIILFASTGTTRGHDIMIPPDGILQVHVGVVASVLKSES
jgi:hypothetical protein